MRKTYESCYAVLEATVPSEQRLEYRVRDAWVPICKFLGKDMPDVAFPHANHTVDIKGRIKEWHYELLRTAIITSLLRVSGLAVTIGYGLWMTWTH